MLLENTKYLYSYIKWFLQFKQTLFSIHIILLMLHNLHKIISTIYAFMQTVVSINIIHWSWSWKCSKDIWLETILTTVLIFICCTELRFFCLLSIIKLYVYKFLHYRYFISYFFVELIILLWIAVRSFSRIFQFAKTIEIVKYIVNFGIESLFKLLRDKMILGHFLEMSI